MQQPLSMNYAKSEMCRYASELGEVQGNSDGRKGSTLKVPLTAGHTFAILNTSRESVHPHLFAYFLLK